MVFPFSLTENFQCYREESALSCSRSICTAYSSRPVLHTFLHKTENRKCAVLMFYLLYNRTLHLINKKFYKCLQMPVWPSAGQILQDQHKDQHMYGIKGIAGILERLAVIALPSAVQPDGESAEVQDLADRSQIPMPKIWTGYSRPPSRCTLTQ